MKLCVAVLMMFGIFFPVIGVLGYFIFRWNATRTAEKYPAEQYVGTDYEIYEVMYEVL